VLGRLLRAATDDSRLGVRPRPHDLCLVEIPLSEHAAVNGFRITWNTEDSKPLGKGYGQEIYLICRVMHNDSLAMVLHVGPRSMEADLD